ncbi:uncharacterized protein LOC116648325 [Phoca vitulina]|uniref:uncharacterized protein LOC116648325 n=1 Tax=Phoca vitulina TaxID=9720 RepID=UPI0013964781|nr:uncharacterized protein LOC116648325 [Phoca vitulina]
MRGRLRKARGVSPPPFPGSRAPGAWPAAPPLGAGRARGTAGVLHGELPVAPALGLPHSLRGLHRDLLAAGRTEGMHGRGCFKGFLSASACLYPVVGVGVRGNGLGVRGNGLGVRGNGLGVRGNGLEVRGNGLERRKLMLPRPRVFPPAQVSQPLPRVSPDGAVSDNPTWRGPFWPVHTLGVRGAVEKWVRYGGTAPSPKRRVWLL